VQDSSTSGCTTTVSITREEEEEDEDEEDEEEAAVEEAAIVAEVARASGTLRGRESSSARSDCGPPASLLGLSLPIITEGLRL